MLPDSLLGHYRILGPIGKGGMGEVYAAEDTKLHRRVALKILPRIMAEDPDRRRRFEREAQAVAALNHPNIVTIYSVEEAAGVPFLTMELVEGRTLRDVIPPGGLPVDALLRVAVAVSDAIAAAHQRGMTHRDLKPANVMVAADGRVKVLDFGLAKLHESEQQAESEQPTKLTGGDLTGEGRIVGTVAYMSPEQAEGKPVDPRSDIFSLGVMLHEMASGERPFKGDTDISVLSSILKENPSSLADLKPDLPSGLARIVRRCLAKEPDRRYQTATDLRNDLDELKQEVDSGTISRFPVDRGPVVPPRRFPIAVVALGSLAVVAIAVAAFVWIRSRPSAQPGGSVFTAERFTRLTESGTASMAALSADGRYVVHVKTEHRLPGLWVRQTATSSDVQIVAPALVLYDGLSFSPDGNYVYYVTYTPGGGIGSLYKMAVLGGRAARVIEDIDSPPTFSPDGGSMAFMRGDVQRGITYLMVARTDGTGARSLAAASGEVRFENEGPAWSHDGKTILVVGRVGTLDFAIFGVDAASGRVQQVGGEFLFARNVKWMPDGRSFMMDGIDSLAMTTPQLWQVSYPSGERRRVTNDLNGYTGISVSGDGRLVATVQSLTHADLWILPAGRGEPREIPGSQNRVVGGGGVAWTPDGHLVFTSQAGSPPQIWIANADGSDARQLTSVRGAAAMPALSPDGHWIYYQSAGEGVHIWRMDADGSAPKQLTTGGAELRPVVSPDGRWIYYTSFVTGQNKPMKMDLDGANVTPLGDTVFLTLDVTPDGSQLIGATWNQAKQRSECALLPIAGGSPRLVGDIEAYAVSSCRSTPAGDLSYVAFRSGHTNLFSRPIGGGVERQLSHFSDDELQVFNGAWSRDGRAALSRGSTRSDIVLISSK